MKGAEANFTDLSPLARGYKLADGMEGMREQSRRMSGEFHGEASALFRVKLFKIGGLPSLFAVAVGNY